MSKMEAYVTIFKLSRPANKIVTLDDEGKPDKSVAKHLTMAMASTVRVDNPHRFAELLTDMSEETNQTMSLGYFPGTEPEEGCTEGEPFQVVTQGIMAKELGVNPKTPEGAKAVLGWHDVDGDPSVCKLKANMVPGGWCLLDIDAVGGEPEILANLTSATRLEALVKVYPELAEAGLVRIPSTTGRVIVDGKPMDATGEHLYFLMNDPTDLERFGAMLLVRGLLSGYGFMRPKFAKDDRTKVIARVPWGVNDPTTFSCERLVYDGKPFVDGEGLSVAKAKIEVIEGPSVDTHKLLDLTTDEVIAYSKLTGHVVVKSERPTEVLGADGEMTTVIATRFLATDESLLRMDTVIETEQGEMTVEDYCKSDLNKLRCQTPFRESSSWNGILNRHKDGTPFVFDNGIRCRYTLSKAQAEKYLTESGAAELEELKALIAATAEAEMPDPKPLLEAFAKMDFGSETDRVLAEEAGAKAVGLGVKVKAFRADIVALKARLKGKAGEKGADAADKTTITEGQWPIDKPLPVEAFPFTTDGVLLGHEANYAFMLKAYGIGFSYDMMSKKLLWDANGLNPDTDNADLVLFSRIKSLAALNGLPNNNDAIHAFLPAIAEAKQVNKVRDHLQTLQWDGEDRIKDLAEALGPHDLNISEISLRRWLIQACAAADGAEIGLALNPSATAAYEYVLVLYGEQGVGKTKGLQRILPRPLRTYLKESVVLNINSKDSVIQAVSCWCAELGEMDATFRAADHVAFKAFMSREYDEMRMPYAAKASRFKRRSVFVGSVNEPEFLKDKTGARRFYPLAVEQGFPEWPDNAVDQLWAQAWSLYAAGEQWWPTSAEAALLGANAEDFRAKSWAETQLEAKFNWSTAEAHILEVTEMTRHTASDVWNRLQGKPGGTHSKMTPLEISDLGHGLRLLWSQNGAYLHKGRLVVDTRQGRVMANATGGKNRGWLLPDSPEDNLKRTVAKVQAMGAAGKEKPDPCGTANPSNTRFPVIQRDVPPENLDHKPTQQQTTGRAD